MQWMHETSAQGWCTGKTQRDRVEREVGGGIGMGNTCKSKADSCQCTAKLLQYCKVISLQLIKINGKKKRRLSMKNWCFWTVVLEKTLESPLGSKEIKPVNPKGNHAEAEAPYFGHLMWTANSPEKTLMLGKIEGWWRRGWQRMVGWHHRLNGHEFKQFLGDS